MADLFMGTRQVGPTHPPLVIAEIGINHEGNLETARQMVDAAAGAGVEVVKHQTHVIEDEMSPAANRVVPGNAAVSIYDIMARCALSERDEQALNVPAFKIGCGECTTIPC